MEKKQEDSSVLSGLFGESSDGSPLPRKKFSHAYGKGRRSIRKVRDKKYLDLDTIVLANTEEFERRRRLIRRQTRLRELLGEDGLNVLVINDEVVLEYDFEGLCPVVTVHPFFTKVMKVHQYEGVKFMWDACFESLAVVEAGHPGGGCILAHCIGLGKTLQVLALLHTVLTHPRVGMQRVLVCCPPSTVLTWIDEIHKWIGPVTNKLKVFELSKRKKNYESAYQLEDWYNEGGIFIIGYELFCNLSTLDPVLEGICPTIVNKIRLALLDPGPDIIVCDEGQLLKDDSSELAVAMNRVATKRRIVLTGTQIQNNPKGYYCMVNFIKPYLLGSYSEYTSRFEIPIMNGQHRDSREKDIKLMKARTHVLQKLLEGCLQRQEASVLYPYLPMKHEHTYFIPLTKCQRDLYKHYLTHYSKFGKQHTMRDLHILQKIWTHPQVLHNFHMKSWKDIRKFKVKKIVDNLANGDVTATEKIKPAQTEVWWLQYLEGGKLLDSLESSNKLLAVFRILDDCLALGDKVLLFSTSLFTMDTLEYFLRRIKNWSLGHEYYRLDSSVPAEVRQKWCREFNADSNQITKLFLISTRAGSQGLNMTAANQVIILDTSWNPAHDIQSISRVYRLGQQKDCHIYRLVALDTMEQKIYERAVTKPAVVDEQQIVRHLNKDELTELHKLFLISTRAGSQGLNMTAANQVIILDTSWNPAHDIQSISRVYRLGQQKDCHIYRLVALDTMEQKIYERAVTKPAVVDEQQIVRHLNKDELTELHKLDESGSGVASGVAVGVTDGDEHDPLLRGSAEQQLPVHKRAATWLQLEQEQAHTQLQNLGQSSLKTPTKRIYGHDYAKLPVHSAVQFKNENDEKVPKANKEPSTSKKIVTDDTTNKESVIEPKKPKTSKKENNKIEKQNEDNDEQIPLHPSLLTNKNFIQLVAHTYMTGNPMLDEDTAVFVAQYSTQKALKVIEMTGKDLCSGPIHDIAVKVVGKDILKKLYTSNINQSKVDKSKIIQTNEDEREHEPKVNQSKVDLKSRKVKGNKYSKNYQSPKYKNKSETIEKSVSAKQIEERKKTSDSDDLVMISDDSTSCAEFKTDTSRKNEKSTKIKLLSPKPEKKKIQKMAQYPPAEDKKQSSTSPSPPKLQTSIPEAVSLELSGSSTNSSSQQTTMAPAVYILSDDDEHFLVSDEDSVYLINEPSPLESEKSPTQKNFSQNNEVISDKQLIVQSNANVKSNINNLTEYVPIKKVTNINKPMTLNNTLEGPAANIQKLSFTPSFKKSLPKTGLCKRKSIVANLSTASKTNSVIMNSVDPTDTVSDNMRYLVGKMIANKSENKNTSKKDVMTLSGLAKDLKIVRTGENSSTLSLSVDLRGASSSRSNDFRATVDTKASDTKKRQKTTVTSEIAKKIKRKSFKILTLKDFDIEDNDDFVDLG